MARRPERSLTLRHGRFFPAPDNTPAVRRSPRRLGRPCRVARRGLGARRAPYRADGRHLQQLELGRIPDEYQAVQRPAIERHVAEAAALLYQQRDPVMMEQRDRQPGLSDGIKEKMQLDVDRWAVWATWARNHIDHGGAERYREIGDFFQLKILADSVRLVAYLAFLKVLRIPDGKPEEALFNHPRLRVLVERCAEISALPEIDD
jgi:hypothetical protein